MIEKHEKSCPYCGGRSPLGTPCSPECEENHQKFHARAVWYRRFYLVTIAVCILWMLRGTIPLPIRAAFAIGWAAWLCLARIIMPYSYRVTGCEKKTERESRLVGGVALALLGVILIFLSAMKTETVVAVLGWIAGLRR